MMAKPKRIQLSRKKGYRKPEGAVVVARPGKWGNQYRVGYPAEVWVDGKIVDVVLVENAEMAVDLHRRYIEQCLRGPAGQALRAAMDAELRGRDLACWCSLDQPCHGDTWIEVSNR